MVVWWGTEVECTSAVCRRERSGDLDATDADAALAILERMREHWHEVQPVPAVQVQARRLLRLHPLRTTDAMQLAAARVVADAQGATLPFFALDTRLARAAKLEGLSVVKRG